MRALASQSELRELARVASPVALDFDDHFKEHPRAENLLELEPRRGADFFQRASTGANQHPLVRLAIDDHRRANLLQVALGVLFEIFDSHRSREWNFLAHGEKDLLAHDLFG